jgi:hypothetical protein
MQSAADGSQCNIKAAPPAFQGSCFGREAARLFRVSRDTRFSDVIEKLLPQPFSCPLSMLAIATSNGASGVPAFQPALTTTQAGGWGR